jgi:hypothetical protein
MTTCCPFCHQTIGTMRLGVRLTPLKTAIVDQIKAAGDIGIASEELMYALWDRDAAAARRDRHPGDWSWRERARRCDRVARMDHTACPAACADRARASNAEAGCVVGIQIRASGWQH